jgi:eukaryotic-like serine/threonine-protein kinase
VIGQLGKYQLLKTIAKGGMAEIHIAKRAIGERAERLIVIKKLRSDLKSNRGFVHLFLNEARIAARLMHSNVVQMYDLGYADGDYFIAMEYIHGEDLYQIAKIFRKEKKKFPLHHALSIIIQTCMGLHYAHTKTDVLGRPLNIVHCDISPQNIVISFQGDVKVVDFGVAKAASRFEKKEKKGTLKGKLPYMSPEQILGKPLDARTDVYATGIVLWELVTGQRRYGNMEEIHILRDIVEGSVPPPNRWNPDLPEDVDAVIMKALMKDPDARFQSAAQMQASLENVVQKTGLTSTPVQLGSMLQRVFADRLDAVKRIEQAQADGELKSGLFSNVPVESLDNADFAEVSSEIPVPFHPPVSLPESEHESPPETKAPDSAPPTFRPVRIKRPFPTRLVLLVILVAAVLLAIYHFLYHRNEASTASSSESTGRGMVQIETDPPGAKVHVDGKYRCESPCIIQELDIGTPHILRVSKTGYDTRTAEFDLHEEFEVRRFNTRLNKTGQSP